MATDLYARCEVYVEGSLLYESTSVRVGRTTKAQLVETMAKGFAGVSPGAKMLTLSIDSAVPNAGFEFNIDRYMDSLIPAEVTLFCAGKTLTSKGFFTDDSFSAGTSTPSGVGMEFSGEWAKWT